MHHRSRIAAGSPALLALAVALLAPCAAAAQESAAPTASAGTVAPSSAAASPAPQERVAARLAAPARVRQGDLIVAWAACAEPLERAQMRLIDASGKAAATARGFDASSLADAPELARASPGAARPRLYGFLIVAPTRLPPGSYELEAFGARVGISVDKRGFASETIKLDDKNTAIRTKPDKRKEEEAKKLLELLGRADPAALYIDESTFVLPVAAEARRSSLFGDRRAYAYSNGGSDASEHAGLDFAVVEGTPVRACARGRVAMVADRIVTGKTLVIEHLPGLYSVYMHLSSIEVAEGAIVERGSRVALSGSTGMSTGPHLHWVLRAGGAAFEPEPLLAASPLDKALIINTIIALIEGR